MELLYALSALLIAIASVLIYRRFWTTPRPPLPPGPKPLPIIGNILDLPPKGKPEFEHWLRLKEQHGPLSSISVFGQTLILVHDKQAVHDLLQKRAKFCSGRPATEFATKLCGYGQWIVLQQDDEYLRRCRKLMHQHLGSKTAMAEFSNVVEVEVHRFLFRVLERPVTLVKHLNITANAIISQIIYGYTIEPHTEDPLVELVGLNMANAQCAASSIRLVDAVPALKYLPSFLPGTGFKKTAREWSRINNMATEIPYSFTKSQMDLGRHSPSFVSNVIEQNTDTVGNPTAKLSQRLEEDLKWCAAMLYNGGLDTTIPMVAGFFQAMVMYPEVQRKAQAEIDRIVGCDRLPFLSDRPFLPYVDAVVQESIRWNPTAPLGFPHKVSEEFVYNGYLFPKGAIIFAGIWWICHDPDIYREPNVFEPARFLDPRNEPNPNTEVFGYGRRVCSGQQLADMSIFLTIAQTLAAFRISKATDKLGHGIDVKLTTNPGFINRPVDFPYGLEPRDANYADMIRQVQVKHPWEKSDAQVLRNDALWQSAE